MPLPSLRSPATQPRLLLNRDLRTDAGTHILIEMKIARYWTRAPGEALTAQGGPIRVTARGWSEDSLDSARMRAQDIARRVAQRIATQPDAGPRYPYGDRPLPEPILTEFREGEHLSAAITRNSYGALVMNADQMMFVDIDRQEPAPAPLEALKSLFSGLFGKPAAPPLKMVDPVLEAVGKVAERQRLSVRAYRTAAGYRVLITDRRFQARSAEAETLLNEFGADTLYVRLCRLQESFRARLSPKPWRLGMRQPPVEFPFETSTDQARYRDWEREYESEAAGYATCAYKTSFGAGRVLPEFDALIRFHDEKAKATSGLPLA
jgi:hypothetical protein